MARRSTDYNLYLIFINRHLVEILSKLSDGFFGSIAFPVSSDPKFTSHVVLTDLLYKKELVQDTNV